MSRTLVFIASSFPHPVSEFLAENGYNVLEAYSADEALALSNVHDFDAVIVADGGPYPGLADLRQRRITINLTVHATGPEVFFELSHILPLQPTRPQ
jgi:hypothetical protein